MKDDDIKSLIKYRIEEARTALDDAGFLIKNKRSAQSIVNRLYFELRHTSDYRVMKPVAQGRIDELHKRAANFVEQVAEYLGHSAKAI